MIAADLWHARIAAQMTTLSRAQHEALRAQLEMCGYNVRERSTEKRFNIFANPTPEADALKQFAIQSLQGMAGMPVSVIGCDAHGIVRTAGEEIQQHTDRDEGDVSAQYFLDGMEIDALTTPVWSAHINRYGDNAFALCDPSLHAAERRLPWDGYSTVWIRPVKGLLVLFPSRIPHFQRHYTGDGTFVQAVINIRIAIN